MFRSKISKEELNQLPVVSFDGEIILIDDATQIPAAVADLRQSNFLGLDTETRPSITRGARHKLSVLHISNLERRYL